MKDRPECVHCGSIIETDVAYFAPAGGGLVHPECHQAARAIVESDRNAVKAAGPDLLAALESLLAYVTTDLKVPEHEVTVIKARRAISRARRGA